MSDPELQVTKGACSTLIRNRSLTARSKRRKQHDGGGEKTPLIHRPAQRQVRIHRILPAILDGIGAQLVDQPDPAPFLAQVQQDTPAARLDRADRGVELRSLLDLPGLVTSAVALFALTYGLIEGHDKGWTSE